MSNPLLQLLLALAENPDDDTDETGPSATPQGDSPPRQLRDYLANALSYTAEGPMGASEEDPVWKIQKIFLTDDYRVKDIQTLTGAWTERASLGWQGV